MTKYLRKCVNPPSIETVPSDLLRRLIGRYSDGPKGIDTGLFDGDPASVREEVLASLKGPEDALAKELVVALHRVADLATPQGSELVFRQARLRRVPFLATGETPAAHYPKHVVRAALPGSAGTEAMP